MLLPAVKKGRGQYSIFQKSSNHHIFLSFSEYLLRRISYMEQINFFLCRYKNSHTGLSRFVFKNGERRESIFSLKALPYVESTTLGGNLGGTPVVSPHIIRRPLKTKTKPPCYRHLIFTSRFKNKRQSKPAVYAGEDTSRKETPFALLWMIA